MDVRNSSLVTDGEALQVNDSAVLRISNVSATSDGSAAGATGTALRVGTGGSGGTAEVRNSTLVSTRGAGVSVESGTLDAENSTFRGMSAGLLINSTTPGSLPTPSATLVGVTVEGGSTGASITNGGQLLASGTRITSTDPTASAGLYMLNGSARLQQGSSIQSTTRGVIVTSTDGGSSTLTLDNARVVSDTGSALYVTGSANAAFSLLNQTSVQAGNGILLEVDALAGNAPHASLDIASSAVQGDVVVGGDGGGTAGITLRDQAQLTGRIRNATSLNVTGAGWYLTGSSNLQQLSLGNGGIIALGDGTAFNTLNVSGDFNGTGGTLLFNTVLAGDDAATDKLVIGGNTSGTANVRANNVRGAGAQTTTGIELVSVAGTSAGEFVLQGRAVGGQYEYFLHKGAGTDGNWYLRSQLPTQPDPCVVDPTLPECTPVDPVDPVLRPEGGAYLANLRASQDMFRIGYHERRGGQSGGLSWARVDGSRQGFDAMSSQLDIHGNSQSLTVGTDVWRADTGSSVGVMLSTGNATSTSTNPLTGYYARGKVKGEALGVYGTWRGGVEGDPYAGFYVDGSLQRAQFRNRVEGAGLATERYDSRAWQGAIETGYAFNLGSASQALYLEPQLQVGYNRWSDARHIEANGTVVTTDDANGLFGRVGLRLSGVTRWEDRSAQVQPYIAANWLHSRADARVRMDDERVDARLPRSRAEVSAGATMAFANGLGVWGGLSRQQASGYHLTALQLGVTYSG